MLYHAGTYSTYTFIVCMHDSEHLYIAYVHTCMQCQTTILRLIEHNLLYIEKKRYIIGRSKPRHNGINVYTCYLIKTCMGCG